MVAAACVVAVTASISAVAEDTATVACDATLGASSACAAPRSDHEGSCE